MTTQERSIGRRYYDGMCQSHKMIVDELGEIRITVTELKTTIKVVGAIISILLSIVMVRVWKFVDVAQANSDRITRLETAQTYQHDEPSQNNKR